MNATRTAHRLTMQQSGRCIYNHLRMKRVAGVWRARGMFIIPYAISLFQELKMKKNCSATNRKPINYFLRILIGPVLLLSLPIIASATQYRTIDHPRQECWNEQVAQPSNGNYGGAIVGGLTGGLLGNQVGRGNGRVAATAVGAATGAVVGDRLSGSNGYTTVQRCRTVIDREQIAVVPERTYYYRDDDYDKHYYKHRKHHKHHKHHKHDDDDDDDN